MYKFHLSFDDKKLGNANLGKNEQFLPRQLIVGFFVLEVYNFDNSSSTARWLEKTKVMSR